MLVKKFIDDVVSVFTIEATRTGNKSEGMFDIIRNKFLGTTNSRDDDYSTFLHADSEFRYCLGSENTLPDPEILRLNRL